MQAVQSAHSALQFAVAYPQLTKEWNEISNYLVCLAVKDIQELKGLIKNVENSKLRFSTFIEPDLGNEITAIVIEPSKETQRLVSTYPLMLRKRVEKNHNTNTSSTI